MPRVKIDYIASFSSEDPEHPASNLLQREVSKKKWLCQRGEPTCSVVLQLPRTVKITGVHIGAYHAALVEVLVGRSETSSEQFQVLVPSSVFISREESRRDAPVVRVRSFGADALSAPARDQRWDRVRVVCSQPHNKHCQFGLSFVHVDEAEGPPAAVPPRLQRVQLDTFSSDEDDFKPGELFAKHLQDSGGERPSNTGAQIRQATSQALKNIADSSTKLTKTIIKPGASRAPSPSREAARSDRARDSLLYTSDDTAPHQRIDSVLSRHQHDKEHANKTKHDKADITDQKIKETSKTKDETSMKNKTKDEPKRTPKRTKSESPPRTQRSHDQPTSAQNKEKEVRKRRRSNSQEQSAHGLEPGPISSEPHTLLRGAVLVLSGYENPQRAAVRATALALGARVLRDWGPEATHLICAFPNTPKLRAVRAAAGLAAPVARADWLENMARRRRLLPWQWYATERRQLHTPRPEQLRDDDEPPPPRHTLHHPDSDADTDDEIEKVLQAQKKRRVTESKTNDDSHNSDANLAASTSDVPQACDEEDEVDTDEEAPGAPGAGAWGPALGGALPDFFDGLTFAIDAAPHDARHMARYVLAYGGLVLTMSEVAEGSEVDYIVRGSGARADTAHVSHVSRGTHVSAAWLACCHRARTLLPHTWRTQ